MADLYHSKFTRFEPNLIGSFSGETLGAHLTPVQYLREWQWPKNAGPGDVPVFKTVRVSEHRWPIRGAVSCDIRDGLTTSDMWPLPVRVCGVGRAELISLGLIRPWHWFPMVSIETKYFWLDSIADDVHARGPHAPNDGLPDDYLEFWQDEESEVED